MKSKLTPFDAETLLMIQQTIKNYPDVEEKNDLFVISLYSQESQDNVIKATIEAVKGRFGNRIVEIKEITKGAIISVKYEQTELPTEIRTDLTEPNISVGYTYCKTIKEIKALPVRRDNVDELINFVGGGIMTIPRSPDGIAKFSFPTENGVLLDVPENWFIVWDNGKFSKIEPRIFANEYEAKFDLHPNTKHLIQAATRMDELFGRDLKQRLQKLSEEYGELCAAARNFILTERMKIEYEAEIIDELADLNAVTFHIAHIFGLSQEKLLAMAMDKIEGRQIDPNYKRRHVHVEQKNEKVCGNCRRFKDESVGGDGVCYYADKVCRCSDLACMAYIDKYAPGDSEVWERLAENAGSYK